MKTIKYFSFIIIFMLFGCASTKAVLSEYDESIDFNQYNTFVLCIDDLFVENTSYPQYDNNMVRQLIGDAIEEEMKRLGHKTNVLKPQLQAGFNIIVEKKEATFYNCEISDEYNYWRESTIDTIVYTEETLVVYVSDFEKNQIIWQASIVCNLNRSKSKLQAYIDELVTTLFIEYPKIVDSI